ncbi:MAG: hypothetical protein SWJ54_13050 [Cyanobacteriota bacterium]|nr:hypothetical protein [Cyanobacteriota bacterium]
MMSFNVSNYSYRVAQEHAEFIPQELGTVQLIEREKYPEMTPEGYTFWMYIDRQTSSDRLENLATIYYPLRPGLPVRVVCSNCQTIEIYWKSGEKGLTREILVQLEAKI